MAGAQEPQAAAKMNDIYRHQRFVYDATRRFYLLGRDRLIADLDAQADGRVLEIGCGTARNLIRAARRYPAIRLYGVDVSAAMLSTARRAVGRRGLEARITLAAGDATACDAAALFGVAGFERVFISYALSMIPSWRDAVRRAVDGLAPGGALHIIDFGDFASYPGWAARLQRGWLRRFSVTPIPDLEAQLAALAAGLGLAARCVRLYGGYAVAARLARDGTRIAPMAAATGSGHSPAR